MNRFLFIGGDKRIIYTARALSQRFECAAGVSCAAGASCAALGLDGFAPPQGRYDCIVLPLPFSRDGENINAPYSPQVLPLSTVVQYAVKGAAVYSGGSSPQLVQLCEENGLKLTDYFASEELTLKNAWLTAEGALALMIQNTDFSLNKASILITGYGRISCYLAGMVRTLGARVTICARSSVQRERAVLDGHRAVTLSALSAECPAADIIVNTVPADLFSQEDFRAMRSGSVFVELATKNSPSDRLRAEQCGIKYLNAPGIPGKYSPKAAGEAIAEEILRAAE